MKYRIIFIVLFLSASAALYADAARSILAGELLVFGDADSSPVRLESQRGWVTVGTIDWSLHTVQSAPDSRNRRWRMRSRYAHKATGGAAAVQVRIRGQNGASVFTHPWTQNAQGSDTSYSNWFEDPDRIVDSSDWSIVEARLISPPRHPLSGILYSLSLEAWDDMSPRTVPTGRTVPEVQLAYIEPLPAERMDAGRKPENHDARAALDFALRFVSYCLEGNLAAYYRSMNDPMPSLNDGTVQYKYSLEPPTGIAGIPNIDVYAERFEYSLHGADAMRELFPEWFDSSRDWTPGPDSYLFMGHRDKLNTADLNGVDFLVFIVEPDAAGKWKVAARPGE